MWVVVKARVEEREHIRRLSKRTTGGIIRGVMFKSCNVTAWSYVQVTGVFGNI